MSSNQIITGLRDGVRIIKFNRPEKKNAVTSVMYDEITNILRKDANDDQVVVTILTGAGDYYSSGNDFSPTMSVDEDDPLGETAVRARVKIIEDFVNELIIYPKLLIAVVNGPAIGIAVTSAALCDVVYASDKATFQVPFISLSLCAEGCSSYLFSRIMGNSKASELLLLGHKMTAEEACKFGFVSEVVTHNKLDQLFGRLSKFGKLPVNSVKNTKRLMRAGIRDNLIDCNKRECEQLVHCLQSEDFMNAVLEMFTRKSKL